jgi:hypothetical protein
LVQGGYKKNEGIKQLVLHDSDPFDYAKAERIFPNAKNIAVEFAITPQQNNDGICKLN